MAARLSTTTFRYSQDHDHLKVFFVTIHFFNVTIRCLLSASRTKEHFAELFFEQTNIITNARPVWDTSVQFAFRSRNVVKRQGLIIYHVLNWQECFTASSYSVTITNATIMNLALLWIKRPSDKLRCKFRWARTVGCYPPLSSLWMKLSWRDLLVNVKSCICAFERPAFVSRSLYQQTIVLQTIMWTLFACHLSSLFSPKIDVQPQNVN